ncbi:MAG: glycosyltransferase involved in cell wall biosynthesis [Psychromonas sp.]|jgi:glycosyltransferase involved in cell wall biosynthesis|uniref:glycosyltransferase family 4 protein n=1 Tax=Psychromonas sp. TaxID=1884585 RepID=UPI0039E4D8EE
MKIALIIPSLENKGPGVFTKYLVEGLIDIVDSVEIFYFNDTKSSLGILDFDAPVRKIGFFDKVDFSHFDIVHTTMLKPDLFAFFNRKRLGGKLVVSMHNYFPIDLRFLYPKLRAFIYAKLWYFSLVGNRNFIVSSLDMKNYYQNLFHHSAKFEIIPYGIKKREIQNVSESEVLLNLKDKYKVIGSCGLLIKRKGYAQLARFLKDNDDYAVILIGEGEERKELEKLISDFSLEERFILLGFKTNSIDYYKYFDVFIMCSYSEGFGLAMLEALSQSLPLVCSNLPIYKEYFVPEDVKLFEPDNIQQLSKAIQEIMHNPDYYQEKSYGLYLKYFSLHSMCEKHLALYLRIKNK